MAFEVEAIAKWFDLFSIVDTSIWSSSSINTLNVDGDSTSSFHQGQLWTKRKFLEILYIEIRNVMILNCEKWKFCFADRAFSCQPNCLFPHCLSCNGPFIIITSVSLKEDPDTNCWVRAWQRIQLPPLCCRAAIPEGVKFMGSLTLWLTLWLSSVKGHKCLHEHIFHVTMPWNPMANIFRIN